MEVVLAERVPWNAALAISVVRLDLLCCFGHEYGGLDTRHATRLELTV